MVLRKAVTGAQKEARGAGGPAGKESPGDQGKVLRVYPETGRVLVEGVRFLWKHQKPTQAAPKGAKIQKEAPIHVSNVMLLCTACGKATRVRHRKVEGRNARVCRKCDAVIGVARG